MNCGQHYNRPTPLEPGIECGVDRLALADDLYPLRPESALVGYLCINHSMSLKMVRYKFLLPGMTTLKESHLSVPRNLMILKDNGSITSGGQAKMRSAMIDLYEARFRSNGRGRQKCPIDGTASIQAGELSGHRLGSGVAEPAPEAWVISP